MGCVVYVGEWVAWVTGVIIFALVAWVKYIFAWVFACVKIFCVGLVFLRGSFLSFFSWVSFYLPDEIILLYYN